MSKFTNFDNFSEYSSNEKLLYIDILNFSEFFFPVREQWNVTAAFLYTKKFVAACKNSGWSITLFIGDTTPSVDTMAVWKSRRAQEIDKCLKNMPMGMATLLGDMFKAEGVRIIYSDEGLSNHDMLAAYAEADGASVLSDDKKFFSFEGCSFPIYGGYSIENRQLKLRTKNGSDIYSPAESRPVLAKPSTTPKDSANHTYNGTCQRGTSTPLTKTLNIDLQAIITPLRLASHASHGVQGPLVELWPYWDNFNGCVGWHEETVHPTATAQMLELLQDPEAAVMYFFGRYLGANKPEAVKWHDWQKHLFCMRSLVYELCATPERTLLSMWFNYEKQNPVKISASKNSTGSNGNNNYSARGGGQRGGGQRGAGGGNGYGGRGAASGKPAYVRNPNTSCYFYEERD